MNTIQPMNLNPNQDPCEGWSDEQLYAALLDLDLPHDAVHAQHPSSARDEMYAVLLDLDAPRVPESPKVMSTRVMRSSNEHLDEDSQSGSTESGAPAHYTPREAYCSPVRVVSEDSYDSGSSGSGRKRSRDELPQDPEERKSARMARNRASAAASRERKKAHLADLQQKINYLLRQNENLARDLRTVKTQHAQLQTENSSLKDSLIKKEQESITHQPHQPYFHKSADGMHPMGLCGDDFFPPLVECLPVA